MLPDRAQYRSGSSARAQQRRGSAQRWVIGPLGAFTVTSGAIVRGPAGQHLLVATAVSQAETNAILQVFSKGAAKAHVPLTVQNIRPLHPGDPQGLSQVFFVVALLAPSAAFGNQLINRIGPRLNEFWHLAMLCPAEATDRGLRPAVRCWR